MKETKNNRHNLVRSGRLNCTTASIAPDWADNALRDEKRERVGGQAFVCMAVLVLRQWRHRRRSKKTYANRCRPERE
jgi:hypothetical protein